MEEERCLRRERERERERDKELYHFRCLAQCIRCLARNIQYMCVWASRGTAQA